MQPVNGGSRGGSLGRKDEAVPGSPGFSCRFLLPLRHATHHKMDAVPATKVRSVAMGPESDCKVCRTGAVRVTRGLRSSGDAAQGLAPDAMAVPQGTKTTLRTPFYSRGRDGCLFSLYRRRSWTAPARLWVQDCMATPKLSTLTRRTLSFQRWLRSCRFAEMPGLTRMSE